MLEVTDLSRAFGGLQAVEAVSFTCAGHVLGIIGPNGAGKTTLFNLLNGFSDPCRAVCCSRGATSWAQTQSRLQARHGPNVSSRAHRSAYVGAAERCRWALFVTESDDEKALRMASAALDARGSRGSRNETAGTLSNHELRLMELARALASRPQLLLMDETLAGLGRQEVEDMIGVIARLAEGRHDDRDHRSHHARDGEARRRLLVLDHGRMLARRAGGGHADPVVIEAYLGKSVDAACSAVEAVTRRLRRIAAHWSMFRSRWRPGQFVAIVGPNGAGKTTLFKAISGIVQTAFRVGVLFEGHDLLAIPPAERAHLGIAHVPEGRQVFKSMTVLENLEMGRTPSGSRGMASQSRAILALFPCWPIVALSSRARLSGGEQQMLRSDVVSLHAPRFDARRAVDGPCADHRRSDLRTDRADPPRGRHHHSAGRATCRRSAAVVRYRGMCSNRGGSRCTERTRCCSRTIGCARLILGCRAVTGLKPKPGNTEDTEKS